MMTCKFSYQHSLCMREWNLDRRRQLALLFQFLNIPYYSTDVLCLLASLGVDLGAKPDAECRLDPLHIVRQSGRESGGELCENFNF